MSSIDTRSPASLTDAPDRRVLRTRPLIAGLALAVVALFATALPAAAHDQLIDSTPAAGAQLDAAPEQVTLSYSSDLLVLGAADSTTTVLVVDGAGRDWVSGPAEVAGSVVTVPLEPGMPGGDYEVRWQVVSSDGHPITGVVPFTVIGAASPEATATPTASPTPTETAETTPASPTPTAGAPEASSSGDDDGVVVRAVLIGLGGAVAAVVVLLVVLRQVRRKRAGAPARDIHDEGAER